MSSLEPDLERLWAEYKDAGAREVRDQLIVHYSPLVKYVAGRVATGLPQNVDQADLVSYGIFGLIDAIEKFDLERGFKFETYAIARIKGNILDELRSIDWVPRSVRAKARAMEKAYSKLEGELHRTPSDSELADELDLTEVQLQTTLGQISFTGLVWCGTRTSARAVVAYTSSASLPFTRTRFGARQTPRYIFHSVTRTRSARVTCGVLRAASCAGSSSRYHSSSFTSCAMP